MRFSFFIFAFIIFISLGCKKKDDAPVPALAPEFETIEPRSYYPIYPGSFWKYKVNDTSEEIISSDPEYKKHCYEIDYYIYSDTVYVPFLNGVPIYGYDHLLAHPPVGGYLRVPFLSETVGDFFHGSYQDARWTQSISDLIWVTEKTKRGTDSIITTKRQYVSGIGSSPVETFYYTEYTKGIGISKYCVIDGATLDTTYKKVLINCFIND